LAVIQSFDVFNSSTRSIIWRKGVEIKEIKKIKKIKGIGGDK